MRAFVLADDGLAPPWRIAVQKLSPRTVVRLQTATRQFLMVIGLFSVVYASFSVVSTGREWLAARGPAAANYRDDAMWLWSPIPRDQDGLQRPTQKAMLAAADAQMLCDPEDTGVLETWVECDAQADLITADRVPTGENIPIIGVEAAGQFFAFATEGMLAPTHSIVTLQCEDVQFAVAYNSLRNTARAFQAPASDPPHRFGVAGLTSDDDVLMVIDGELFHHGGRQFPLAELACEQTTWEDWRAKHPTTAFCPGGMNFAVNG